MITIQSNASSDFKKCPKSEVEYPLVITQYKYVGFPYSLVGMYAGFAACCPLVSHCEYAPRALLRLEKRRGRRTDKRTDARPLYYA